MCFKAKFSFVALVVVSAIGLARTVLGDMAGQWKFDEARGTVAHDSSGNGNDGALVGNPTWGSGYENGGLQFDGEGDYVNCGAGASLNITGSVTVAAWVRLGGTANDRKIGGNQDGQSGGYKLGVYNSRVEFEIRTATNTAVLNRSAGGGTALEMGMWYHVVGVYSQGEYIRTYVNGLLDRELTTSALIGSTTGTFKLGREPFSDSYFWLGAMDDVRVYNRALTEQDVGAIVRPPVARNPEPADGATDVVQPQLSWDSAGFDVAYDIYFGTTSDLTEADLVAAGTPSTMYYHVAGLQPGVTYYWRVDTVEVDGTTHTGHLWSFTSSSPTTACRPSPSLFTVGPGNDMVTLDWLPSLNAAAHDVYFGTDWAEVAAADTSSFLFKGQQTETTFVVGPVEPATTYYWRIDEIDPNGAVQPGPVWSLATSSRIVIDDFESYNDDAIAGTAIFQTWIDGFGYGTVPGNGSGMSVGYAQPPFAEQTVVYSGRQSMPLQYDNVSFISYSEAQRSFAVPRDWTIEGVEILSLYIQGRADNTPEPLYVGLEDAAGRTFTVFHPNQEIVLATEWTEWQILLSQFTGVNPAGIVKVFIGVGDRSAPRFFMGTAMFANSAGGVGIIYVDCVSLLGPSWPVDFWGYVRNADTKQQIPNVNRPAVVFREPNRVPAVAHGSDLSRPSDGEYHICVPVDRKYKVVATADDYSERTFDLIISLAGKVTVSSDDPNAFKLVPPKTCGMVGLDIYLKSSNQ